MRQEQSERLAASIVEFGHFLRMRGLSAEPGQTITALEAIKAINATDRQTFAFALQAALCSTNEEWELFPKLFQEFWGESPRPRLPQAVGNLKGKRRNGKTALLYFSINPPTNCGETGKASGLRSEHSSD
jgi:uncharacterized protein with von Willebrand factor type A (vWA) domain